MWMMRRPIAWHNLLINFPGQGVFFWMPALPEAFVQFLRGVYGTEAANAWVQRLPVLLEECAEILVRLKL